jgi:hypothetical protein
MRFYPVGAFAAQPALREPALPRPGPVARPEPPQPQPFGQLAPGFCAPPMPGYPLQLGPPLWAPPLSVVQNAQRRAAAETLMRLRWAALRQWGSWSPAGQPPGFPRWFPF